MTDLTHIIAEWRKHGTPGPWANEYEYERQSDCADYDLARAAPAMADRIEALEAALSEWAGARASVVSGVVGTWERLAEAESRLARLNRKPPQ